MGRLAAKDKQPSSKFVFPGNLDASLKENQSFILKLAIRNLVTGFFSNSKFKYYSAPQVRYTLKSLAQFLVQESANGPFV